MTAGNSERCVGWPSPLSRKHEYTAGDIAAMAGGDGFSTNIARGETISRSAVGVVLAVDAVYTVAVGPIVEPRS